MSRHGGTRHVAIVGSGPAGFFAAQSLLSASDVDVHVDMFERLATPTGLVRAGVAPDHPKIKRIAAVFEKTAVHERFRFFGNVELGNHVARETLLDRYDAVLYCLGAQGERTLNIPGEELPGVTSARSFVGWYNGHPDFAAEHFDLNTERAIVIGNGNVALDVARMLVTPVDVLRKTDIADHALEALAQSRIREVVLVGRRGAEDAAFTSPEVSELGRLPGVCVNVRAADLPGEGDETLGPNVRNLDALRSYVGQSGDFDRQIDMRFRLSPVELRGEGRLEQVVLASTGPSAGVEVIGAGMLIRAVGYRGMPIDGLPFDVQSATVPNAAGRVQGRPREYVAGWMRRGPSGIIGTNKVCAAEVVRSILEDFGVAAEGTRSAGSLDWLAAAQCQVVTWDGWRIIDTHEASKGDAVGRPRIKVVDMGTAVALGVGEARSAG